MKNVVLFGFCCLAAGTYLIGLAYDSLSLPMALIGLFGLAVGFISILSPLIASLINLAIKTLDDLF